MKNVMNWNTPGGAGVRWERDGAEGVYGHYDCTGCDAERVFSKPEGAQIHALGCHVLPD